MLKQDLNVAALIGADCSATMHTLTGAFSPQDVMKFSPQDVTNAMQSR
jgi:hypothetical protein